MTGKKSLYFIAIIPPEDLSTKIHQVKEEVAERSGAKHALKTMPHITLVPPFGMNEETLQQIIFLLEKIKWFDSKVEIRLKNYNHFHQDVIFIDVESNEKLRQLSLELKKLISIETGVTMDPADFHPHITLAFRDLRKEAFRKLWNEFRKREFNESFTANSFRLLNHDGKKWELINEFF